MKRLNMNMELGSSSILEMGGWKGAENLMLGFPDFPLQNYNSSIPWQEGMCVHFFKTSVLYAQTI